MARLPKKNISPTVRDIQSDRHMTGIGRDIEPIRPALANSFRPSGDGAPRTRSRFRGLWRRIVTATIIVIVIGAVAVTYRVGRRIAPPDYSDGVPASGFEDFLPALERGFRAYTQVGTFAVYGAQLVGGVSEFVDRAPELLFHNGGDELLNRLRELRTIVQNMRTSFDAVRDIQTLSIPGFSSPHNPLAFVRDLERIEQTLGACIEWLSISEPRRIAVLFLNTSEMRPGGGFLGSFADITIRNGSLEHMEVRDINEIDRTLQKNIVPPKPLAGLVSRWRSADSNWFFDFRDSAEKTLSLFDAADFYARDGVKFDAAIAVTPRVLADILSVAGPIVIDGRSPLTADTVLFELQKSVQDGQAVEASSPKQILTELAPRVIDAVLAADRDARFAISEFFEAWAADRDIALYFRNADLEQFADRWGVAGRVYELPLQFEGDYLAVVPANIGGGKTDMFIDQNTVLDSQIGLDGLVTNQLTITRSHRGHESKYWWYRVPNRSYMQMFVAPNAEPISIAGLRTMSPVPKAVSYASYVRDPDITALESTARALPGISSITQSLQSGKAVFAGWVTTPLYTTSTIAVAYQHQLFASPRDGSTYTLVLERPLGGDGAMHVSLAAPVGFVWKETNLPVFEYDVDRLPGRVVFVLTFARL